MTPTTPFPAEVRPLSWLIAEKLLSKDVTLSPLGTPAVAEVWVEVEVPHAAAMMASAPTQAISSPCLRSRNFNSLLFLPALAGPYCATRQEHFASRIGREGRTSLTVSNARLEIGGLARRPSNPRSPSTGFPVLSTPGWCRSGGGDRCRDGWPGSATGFGRGAPRARVDRPVGWRGW